MTEGGNAEGKRSERPEGEEVLRTVECLRGRLMAERTASRKTKEEADRLGSKLIELETRLKEETKSRNKAEKRLKSLMKKLESLEIFYVSDESERSGFVDRSEISSASSIASTSTKEAEHSNVPTQNIQDLPVEKNPPAKSPSVPVLEIAELSRKTEAHTENSHPNSSGYGSTTKPEQQDDHVDNSLALVAVDLPKTTTNQRIDPVVLDATVKEVLDALKHAKEKLQTSMERRRMISVG